MAIELVPRIIALQPNGAGKLVPPDLPTPEPETDPPGMPDYSLSATTDTITATIVDAAGATSFEIRARELGGTFGQWIAGLTVSNLTASTEHEAQARGANSVGTGPSGAIVAITTAAPPVAGTPSISGVSGTLADGQEITITGSSFGTKATPAPVTFERFEGVDGTLLYNYDPAWIKYYSAYTVDGSAISNIDSHSGTTSAYSKGNFETNYFKLPPTDTIRVSHWFKLKDLYFNGEPSFAIVKFLRIGADQDIGGGGVYSGNGIWHLSSYNPSYKGGAYMNGTNGDGFFSEFLDPQIYLAPPQEKWVQFNMMSKLGTPGVQDGYVEIEIVGTVRKTFTVMNRAVGDDTIQHNSVLLGNMAAKGSGSGHNLQIFSDDVYIDTAWNSVEIGNDPDYFSCTHREMCPITTEWADGQIKASFNPGTLPAGTNYLFVRGHDGTPSTGYAVTI